MSKSPQQVRKRKHIQKMKPERTNRKGKTKWQTSPTISIIALNINGLSTPVYKTKIGRVG